MFYCSLFELENEVNGPYFVQLLDFSFCQTNTCMHTHSHIRSGSASDRNAFFSLFCLFLVVVHFVLHQLCKTDETKIEWNGFLCPFHSIVSVSRRTNRHQSNMVWVRRFVDKHSNEKAGIQNNYNNAVLHFNI